MLSSLPAAFCERMRRLCGSFDPAAFYAAPLHRGLRVNSLKSSAAALSETLPFSLTPAPFAAGGYYAPADFAAGAHPMHHAGAFYMQEPSAMAAVTLLSPQAGERVLDLCAAPGGKSTQIAAALGGKGLLWCNEYVRARATALLQNLERCGVQNAVVSSMDTAPLCDALAGFFDAVLCDLPCSGEGMFRKEPAALREWSEENIRLCAARGASILDAAAKAVRVGGRLMVSTCTFAPEENELQIAAFLHRHPEFTLLPLQPPFGRAGFPFDAVASFAADIPAPQADLTFTRRIFPADGGEGHFFALLQKTEGDPCRVRPFEQKERGAAEAKAALSALVDLPQGAVPARFGERWHLLPADTPRLDRLNVLRAGIPAADIAKNRLEPTHTLFMACGHTARARVDLSFDDPRVLAFLRGEPIAADGVQGYAAVCIDGCAAGFGKASNGTLKNHYPKGLRLLG